MCGGGLGIYCWLAWSVKQSPCDDQLLVGSRKRYAHIDVCTFELLARETAATEAVG